MRLSYFGHNCFLIEGNTRLLIDPFIRNNPLAGHINVAEIKTDFILLTHGHGDHVADCEEIAKANGAKIIATVEVASWFEARGLETHGLNFGGTFSFNEQTTAKYLHAQHSSSMPDGSYGGQPGSFMIQSENKTVFIAGDTSLHYDLKLYGELYSIDLAVLPIGGNYTMDAEDAALAAGFLGVQQVIGCHYDSFPIIAIDHEDAHARFREKGIELELLEIGQKYEV